MSSARTDTQPSERGEPGGQDSFWSATHSVALRQSVRAQTQPDADQPPVLGCVSEGMLWPKSGTGLASRQDLESGLSARGSARANLGGRASKPILSARMERDGRA
jgi:hypothetical protein